MTLELIAALLAEARTDVALEAARHGGAGGARALRAGDHGARGAMA
jgi:hypothetical protein